MDKIQLINKRYELAQANQKNKLDIFNAIDDVLNQKTKDFTHVSALGSPYAWAAVEMVTPRTVAKNPTINYEPREQNDVHEAQNASDLFKYWAGVSSLFNKLTAWAKVAHSYGSGVVKVTWKTEKRKITKFVYDDFGTPMVDQETEEFITEEEEITTYDDPHIELVSNNYLFFSPGSTDPNDPNCNWIIHKYWKVLDDLKEENKQNKIYKNLGRLEGIKGKDESTNEKERHEASGQNPEEHDDTVDMIEILEMWDKVTGRQIMLANGKEIILDRPFPYWHGKVPFIKLNDSIVPFEWYGKGEVEPILKDIYAIDVLQNARLDDLTGKGGKWKIKGDNIDESELYEPDLPLHVGDGNLDDATFEAFPDVTSKNSEEIARREGSIQNTLGINDFTPNADSNADRTATGMTIKSEQSNARFAHKIQLFESALQELGEMVLALYQQFLTSERSIRILGEQGAEWKTILPGDIAGDFDCIPEAGSTQSVDKNAEKQEYTNAYAMMKDNPYFNQDEVNKKLAEKFFPKDWDSMVENPEEVKRQQLTELLQSPQVQQLIQDQAMQIAQEQLSGFEDQNNSQENELNNKLLDHQLELEKIRAKQGM